jgi:AcrR family transcriptional regulator
VARAGTKKRVATTGADSALRGRIVEAALEALKEDGYQGASARAIAKRGGFSQGAVFYHFGSMREILLAALDETSARRTAAYEDAMREVESPAELVDVAARVFREDLRDGHVKVLAELISAASVEPGLGDEVAARIGPWMALTGDTLQRVLGTQPLLAGLPFDSLAFAVVALYLGVDLLTHLSGDERPAEDLFALAARVLTLL